MQRHQLLVLLKSASLLLSLQQATATSSNKSNNQKYTPIGHGKCHDIHRQRYIHKPITFHHHHHDHDAHSFFQSFYEIPRNNNDSIRHLNSISECDVHCSSFVTNPYFRGYEIVIGRGCYCLFDAEVRDAVHRIHPLVYQDNNNNEDDSKKKLLEGSGRITGSDEKYGGYFCYSFNRAHPNENTDETNSVKDTNNNYSHYYIYYEPVHRLVGKGSCHDNHGRTYPYILHSTDGSNLQCRKLCNLVTPLEGYRGYETYTHDRKCACLYDTSFTTRRQQFDDDDSSSVKTYELDGRGEGGEGNIKGTTSMTRVGFNDGGYCYRLDRIMKKTAGPNGRVDVVNIPRVSYDRIKEDNTEELGLSASFQKMPKDAIGNGGTKKIGQEEKYTYELVGEGICIDKNGGYFDAVEFRDTTATDCPNKCEVFTMIQNYRGIEVTLGNICFCLFDDGTILSDAKVLNYGKGKGEIAGVDKKDGTSGPFCFRLKPYTGSSSGVDDDDEDDDLNHLDYHEEASKEKMRRDAQDKTAGSPTSQPSSTDKGDSTQESSTSFEQFAKPPPHTYNSIFVPHQTRYDFLRFDPYSFSGAPLGGWGRDTRNRLASLPIRLVHGFEGNWNEMKSEDGDDANNDDDLVEDVDKTNDLDESSEMEINSDGSQVSQDNNLDSNKESTVDISKKVVAPVSRPPHFIIHDGTGQKYICRVYYDDELVVVSRMDSMFLPAITVEENGGSPGTFETKESEIIDKSKKQASVFNLKVQAGEKTFVQISSNGININGESLEGTISSAVTKMLNKLGLNDENIMADLAAMADEDAVGGVEDVNAWLTEIGMAAAVGAGVNGAAKTAASAGIVREEATARKLSYREILDVLDSLKGVCSQAHLGWWSYEWCHFQEVKQFHISVVKQGDGGGNGKQVKFEIQDMTLIGHFNGRFDIVYPASKRHPTNDEEKGTTMTMQFDSNGNVLDSDIRTHSEEEYTKWQASHKENEVIRNYYKSSNFDNRGPIIKHKFIDGDMCDEVGRPREIAVDMRCCTEDEMLKWVKAITRDSSKRKSLTKKDLPKAAIVGLAESKTEICTYQAHVCTPALCPDPSKTLTAAEPKEAKIDGSQTNLVNALDTASNAIASTLTNLIGENLDVEDVQVYFGNEENTALLEEVLNNGANPDKLQVLLNQFFKKVEPAKKLSTLEMKEGESVRELLDRTLGKKPCLKKNLGWWTYGK